MTRRPAPEMVQRATRTVPRRPTVASAPALAAVLMMAITVCDVGSLAHAQAGGRDPSDVEAELAGLRAEIAEITETLERQRTAAADEQDALAAAEREIAALTRSLRETGAELDDVRSDLTSLQSRADALQSRVDEQRERLAGQLQTAYRLGAQSRLRTLLNAEDPNRISRQLAMHGYLGRARAELVDELVASRQELAAVLDQRRSRERTLDDLLTRQETTLNAQQDARAERERALAELRDRIRTDESRLAERRAAAAELEALLSRLAGALDDIPPELAVTPFSDLRGELPMPLNGRVRAAFSDRRNAESAWQGWLIDAETGDEVRAVAYGRVAYADWLRGYGMMLIIDHGDGWMSLYGHNQALLADVGDWVEPGEPVSLAGASGGEARAGLYFQLRQDGAPVDPARWIQR